MSVGVILLRGQPIHTGHIEMINQATKENDEVLIILGSADKSFTERNPFHIEMRMEMLDLALDEVEDRWKVSSMWLNDWSSDSNIPKQDNISGVVDNPADVNNEWGLYLYYNIVSKIKCKEFTFYYNDDINLLDAWFPKYIRDRLTVKSIERIGNFSSSDVRKALLDLNMDYLHEALSYLDKGQILKLRYCLTTKKWGSLYD